MQPPKGFAFGHTRKVGTPGRWVVQQEGGGEHPAQLDADPTRNRFPVAALTDVSAKDVDVSVRFRPVSGDDEMSAFSGTGVMVHSSKQLSTRSATRTAASSPAIVP